MFLNLIKVTQLLNRSSFKKTNSTIGHRTTASNHRMHSENIKTQKESKQLTIDQLMTQ